jgi:hypothetical protein
MIASLIPVFGGLLDKVLPDKEAAAAAKLRLLELDQAGETQELKAARDVIVAEAGGESWLQRNWRPITMLLLVGLLGAHWFGFTAPNVTPEQVVEFTELVKLGLGGYVVGRSAEKGIKAWKEK